MNVRGALFPVAVAIVGVLSASCGSEAPEPRKQATASPPAPASPQAVPSGPATPNAYAGDLPPLPASNFPAARPIEIVNAAYAFAARRPDVLRYVPCFCGCERNGHMHNEDCFVAGRDSTGKPRWDMHGMS